jgi:arabinose-5-phosphate isomerase
MSSEFMRPIITAALRGGRACETAGGQGRGDNPGMSLPPTFDPPRVLTLARETLDIEAQAVLAMAARLDERFVRAVELLLACKGRVVVMGMGKSGHIGRKITATLASTGTPAMFVHPAEASHGDLGMITAQDVVLGISNSGESEELTAILPLIKRMGVPLLAFTGRLASTLGRHADVVLDTSVEKEACPHNLAPTASTTAQLALGDALAVALLDARGFKADDFARSHPGGALGRKLLTHVSDVMRSGDDVPRVGLQADLMTLMREISAKGLGMSAIVDADDRVLGIFTDGDLRRLIEKTGSSADLRALSAADVMHPNPRTVSADALAVEAADLMEASRITSVLVVDVAGRLCGALNSNDLMRAKVI